VVREALHNVSRHARATHVSVILQRKARSVSVIIEDNGTGFDAAAFARTKQNPHLGLAGIKERVALINGELAIESRSGGGTTLIVRLPLSRRETKESHG
jgi:signal transduction histidine kinase